MLKPARTERGEIFLYDIYVAGKWIGSRRSLAQAIDALRWHNWPSAVIGENSPGITRL